MSLLIDKIIGIWSNESGRAFEVFYEGDSQDWLEMTAQMRRVISTPRKLQIVLACSNGVRVKLPFSEIPEILPDRSGVVVIFSRGQYIKEDGTDYFPEPDNAVVFNADGSLRFQVKNPEGLDTSFSGFNGSTFNILTGKGEFRLAVRNDHPLADYVHSYLYDGKTPYVQREGVLNIRL